MNTEQPPQKNRSQPPPLPEPRAVTVAGNCVVKYVDVQPAKRTSRTPTIVLVHGSPGTYKDFRYLIPLLQHRARVIGINLPGFGGSEVLDMTRYYEHISAIGAATIVYDALAQVCKDDENVFIMGHSFGGHTTINLAAMNLEHAKLRLRGIGLLASAGYRPHRAMWPMTTTVIASIISSEVPVFSSLASSFVRVIYTNMGFPGNEPTSHYVSGLMRVHSTSFDLVNEHVKLVAHLPSFIAYAKDDVHIEEEILERMSATCLPGPRFVFESGGHNIQKSKAEFLAVELMRWVDALVGDTNSE
ncbi:hypothetical protein PybrP1_008367 [[Pythium] brassicae (nom. inval.)]|nr:hypothetical protein PybrP1_008367 [[Pythium] brassicae (nom. inval.)]